MEWMPRRRRRRRTAAGNYFLQLMLLLVWSLFHHAVRFGRRQRLASLLWEHLSQRPNQQNGHIKHGKQPGTTANGGKSICCRSCSSRRTLAGPSINTANTLLRRVPSEPALPLSSMNGLHTNDDDDDGANQLYCDGQKEIVATEEVPFLSQLRLSDWALDSPLFSQIRRRSPSAGELIYFVVRAVPSDIRPFPMDSSSFFLPPSTSSSLTPQNLSLTQKADQMPLLSSGDVHFLASFACPFAHQRANPALRLYTATLSDFVELVFCWSEGTLFGPDPNLHIDEIQTIPAPFGPGQLPSYRSFHRLQQPKRSDYASLPASRRQRQRPLSTSAMATVETERQRRRPPSLLELLFQREASEESSAAAADESFRRWNSEQNCRINGNCAKNIGVPLRSSSSGRSRFSTASLPHQSGQLPNYLQKLRHQKKRNTSTTTTHSSESDFASVCGMATNGTATFAAENKQQQERGTSGNRQQSLAEQSSTNENEGNSGSADTSSDNKSCDDSRHHQSTDSISCPTVRMKAIPAAMVALRRTIPPAEETKHICNSSSTISSPPATSPSNNTDRPPPHPNRSPSASEAMNLSTNLLLGGMAPLGHCHHLSRSTSVMPTSSCANPELAFRRRSLSPLTISLLVNYGVQRENSASTTALLADPYFPGKLPQRRVHSAPRRSFGSIRTTDSADTADEHGRGAKMTNGLQKNGVDAKNDQQQQRRRPLQKPPSLLVYCGDNKELFGRIQDALRQIVPMDTYTISALSTRALLAHPWMDTCACLIVADTARLDDTAWTRLHSYFVNCGKMLFVCENSLLASLTSSQHSHRQQSALIKNVFGNKSITATMGKEFGSFLKRALKGLAKKGEINETFYARDTVGDTRFSVVLFKKKDQPLLLYMQNLGQRASALFSDATTEQLLRTGNGSLIRDALHRLGLRDILGQNGTTNGQQQKWERPALSPGYLIGHKDIAVLDIPGMAYDQPLGFGPLLYFHRPIQQQQEKEEEGSPPLPPTPSADVLPIEVRRRREGVPAADGKFDVKAYYGQLATKRLGKLLLYVPVCGTTMEVSGSLSRAFPLFDGILVVASTQLKGRGRAGNDWISPAGCAAFTFNFNIPLDSQLGRSLCFLQHIMAVAVASAVSKLLADDVPDFPIRLKWPNDIYYDRSYKLGGLVVQASMQESSYLCLIGVGLNVANSKPTISINDMLPVDSNRHLTVEEVIAMAMNEFEHFVNVFENKGRAEFLKAYYRFWMHSHEEVQILHKEQGVREKVVIRGLDEHGYLEVRSKETGQTMSVMDDGNTFDLFHGLICSKE